MYTRPLIRRRLGSASGGYINWSSVYAVWLCAAVFYHLPSLDTLGLDLKADVSMLITVFLGSLVVLASLNGAYSIGVLFRVLSPRLLDRTAGARDIFTTVVLNSMNLALACSSYYSLCGNAPNEGDDSSGGGDAIRSAVCVRWLHPLPADRHSAFSAWVIYGESAANETSTGGAGTGGSLRAGSGNNSTSGSLSSGTISPVFTTWLTLFAMLLVNSAADYLAGAALSAAYSIEERRDMLFAQRRAASRRLSRRRSAEYPSADRPRPGTSDSYASLGLLSRMPSKAGSLENILKTVSSVGSLWSPTALETMGLKAASALLFRDDFGVGLAPPQTIEGVEDATPVPGSLLFDPDVAAGVGMPVAPDAPAPSFLPMFPWYSGTSADLIKTLFDLMVSVKVFLGRFDARTMQAATANAGGGGGAAAASGAAAPPHDGDGFTFEHLADHDEAWIDFAADTGDGGDSTYSVARCLAAPKVTIEIPKDMVEASGAPPSLSSSTTRVLPRATCLVHGGDLAYPNPTDETYEQRLFGPYQDAFPPPAHIHPGNLVVNKPDLPPEYWEAAERTCTCNRSKHYRAHNGHQQQKYYGQQGQGQPCHVCLKAGALAAYEGPSAFLIPGNHDWIDGLETFTRHVVHKGWLGGWLLPQEKSYFALHLPRGWWLFAMDLALEDDLDMAQYRYFARMAEERMGPNDSAIIVSHAPHWLINWFWGKHEGKNLRQLLRGPLRGRARMHLCGDLHFYMRHSFKPYARDAAGVAAGGISPPMSELSTPAGGSPLGGGSPTASRCATPLPDMSPPTGMQQGQLHQSLLNKLKAVKSVASPVPGSSPVAGAPGGLAAGAAAAGEGRRGSGSGSKRGGFVEGSDDEVLSFSGAASLGASPPDAATLAATLAGVTGGLFQGNSRESPNTAGGGLPPLPPGSPSSASLLGTSPPLLGGDGSHTWWPSLSVRTQRAEGATSPVAVPLSSPLETHALPPSDGAEATSGATSSAAGLVRRRNNSYGMLHRLGGGGVNGTAQVPGGASPRIATNTSNTNSNSTINAGGIIPTTTTNAALSISGISVDGEWDAPPPGWLLNDPEHLIVCGSGGAFLHPTHVFSYARFRPPQDPAAGPIYLRPSRPPQTEELDALFEKEREKEVKPAGVYAPAHPPLRRSLPSDSSVYSLPRRATQGAAGAPHPAGGEYRCQAAFPTPQQSLRLGRSNLHKFRHVNSRFDVIGGVLYYLLVVSVLPRCTGVAGILDAHSVLEGLQLFAAAAWDTVIEIFSNSYISLVALAFLFFTALGFASSGGVGAISGVPPAARRRPEYKGFALAVRARLGGLPAQLAYAAAHTAVHLSAAVTLVLLLELGVEMVIRYEGVGQDGYSSLYRWYRSFEAQHFPDPAGVRSTLSTLTLGLYPNVIKWAFALFDVPEAIAVSRNAICAAGGSVQTLSRLQILGYYNGILLYFWVLATPTVGLMFGLYLYFSNSWLHVHYDESFSALQVPHHKGFLRLHVTRNGDLEVFALGLEESPSCWREDPRWKGVGGGGAPGVTSHRARWPSRWIPVIEKVRGGGRRRVLRTATPPEANLKVVDYIYVPKQATRT